MTLLDRLHAAMDRPYLSDLRRLDRRERSIMARLIAQIPPADHALAEWNDALAYLMGACGQPTCEEARKRLIALLERRAWYT